MTLPALRMETVVLPDPGPPVIKRCPSDASTSFWPPVSSSGICHSSSCSTGLRLRRVAESLDFNNSVPDPLRNLYFSTLRQKVRHPPVPLRPQEVLANCLRRFAFWVRKLRDKVGRPFEEIAEALKGCVG